MPRSVLVDFKNTLSTCLYETKFILFWFNFLIPTKRDKEGMGGERGVDKKKKILSIFKMKLLNYLICSLLLYFRLLRA